MTTPPAWTASRFLIVDDEVMIRDLIARVLRSFGCRHIDQAKSAEEALPYLFGERQAPDCVLLDIAMTPTNGLDLAFTIRFDPRTVRYDIPIIMLTGRAEEELVKAAKLLDVSDFILKPASRATLMSRIDRALTRYRATLPRQRYTAKLANMQAQI
jgi:CheY-like chemotaxis protein